MKTLLSSLVLAIALSSQSAYHTISVCASGCDYTDADTAVDAAAAYQTATSCIPVFVNLAAGETFGRITLPSKPHSSCGWPVYVQSSQISSLAEGVRVGPGDEVYMAEVRATSASGLDAVIIAASGSQSDNWVIRGLEVTGSNQDYGILFDDAASGLHKNIIVDRVYMHADSDADAPWDNCIALLADKFRITNSHFGNCAASVSGNNKESKGILISAGRSGLVRNNLIQSYSIGSLVGGGSVAHIETGHLQSDLQFQGNYYTRLIRWWHREGTAPPSVGNGCYDGQYYKNTSDANDSRVCVGSVWTVTSESRTSMSTGPKNGFELKAAARVVAEGNVFENCWLDTANQSQRCAVIIMNLSPNDYWSTIKNVTFRYNRAKKYEASWVLGLPIADYVFNAHHRNITITNNLLTNARNALLAYSNTGGGVDGSATGGTVTQKVKELFIGHNTYAIDDNTVLGSQVTGSTYTLDVSSTGVIDGTLEIVQHSNILPFYARGVSRSGAQAGLCLHAQANIGVVSPVVTNLSGIGSVHWRNDLYVNNYISSYAAPTIDDAMSDICSGSHTKFRSPSTGRNPSMWSGYNTNADVFTDAAGDNFRPLSGVLSATYGLDGGPIGADIDAVEVATAHTEAGTHNPWFDMSIRKVVPTSDGAEIHIVKPTSGSCTVTVDTNRAFDSDLGTDSPVTSGRTLVVTVSGLNAKTAYYAKVDCDGYPRETDMWITLP
jgi:hypothetical protein